MQLPSGSVQVSRFDFDAAQPKPFRVLMLHDLSFADRRQRTARDFVLVFVAISVLLLALLFVLVAWLQLRRWVKVLIGDIRGKRFLDDAESPRSSLPILSQVRQVLAEVEETQRLEIDFHENWTPQALRQVVRDYLHSSQVIIVSNREPYIHNFDAQRHPVVQVPASGMVTALEPIMRACSGVWVAHGAGTADRETVDRYDQIRVPPDNPSYTLRRVWLTSEQEQGYYYGFSNEGLWPLCHLAYVRPAFRASDWRAYEEVNAKFAEVVAAESTTDSPVVLIQDFHFALLPQLIRAKIPKATIALFWHIPWPNAETFGVCPWKREMLLHMLSADILGFHTRYHCQNFLDSVDRFVECQIDHEHMTVTLQGPRVPRGSLPDLDRVAAALAAGYPGHRHLPHVGARAVSHRRRGHPGSRRRALGLHQGHPRAIPGVGDIARQEPAAPRAHLLVADRGAVAQSIAGIPGICRSKTYSEVERINAKFAEGDWRPIILVDEHQEPQRVFELYRAADFCLVNSLHDGMNLVAKEFVAARDDEDGVLILSTFAGASRELTEAVLINPFDVNETADAMVIAMRMGREERRNRMSLMRRTVKERNVYRWAGRMLMDAAHIRQRQSLPLTTRRHGTSAG